MGVNDGSKMTPSTDGDLAAHGCAMCMGTRVWTHACYIFIILAIVLGWTYTMPCKKEAMDGQGNVASAMPSENKAMYDQGNVACDTSSRLLDLMSIARKAPLIESLCQPAHCGYCEDECVLFPEPDVAYGMFTLEIPGKFQAKYQADNNFVVYEWKDKSSVPVFASRTVRNRMRGMTRTASGEWFINQECFEAPTLLTRGAPGSDKLCLSKHGEIYARR